MCTYRLVVVLSLLSELSASRPRKSPPGESYSRLRSVSIYIYIYIYIYMYIDIDR